MNGALVQTLKGRLVVSVNLLRRQRVVTAGSPLVDGRSVEHVTSCLGTLEADEDVALIIDVSQAANSLQAMSSGTHLVLRLLIVGRVTGDRHSILLVARLAHPGSLAARSLAHQLADLAKQLVQLKVGINGCLNWPNCKPLCRGVLMVLNVCAGQDIIWISRCLAVNAGRIGQTTTVREVLVGETNLTTLTDQPTVGLRDRGVWGSNVGGSHCVVRYLVGIEVGVFGVEKYLVI